MKYIFLIGLFFSHASFAMDKTIIISRDTFIDYEVPDDWHVFKKHVSTDLAMQSIKIVNDDQSNIEILFADTKNNSNISTPKKALETVLLFQNVACNEYIKPSVEGIDTRKSHDSTNSVGVSAIYTDKSDEGYKYAGCVNYVLKDKKNGILMSATLRSKSNTDSNFQQLVKVIDSFRVRAD